MLLTDIDSNIVYFSQWITDFACYKSITQILNLYQIKYSLLPYTKDYWIRDFMPIQISETEFIQYKYKPDYLQSKQYYITNPDICCKHLNIPTKKINIIFDGGNCIKCSDCIIMTDKVFLENSNLSKIQVINILEETFQCEIVFIPWDKNEKYGHADGMVRHIMQNKILLNNYINIDKPLRNRMLNILQNRFDIIELDYNIPKQSIHNWAYINFLQIGNLILLPALDILEDKQAYKQFSKIFEGVKVEQVNISEIVKLGGALNCISWNIKYNKV